MHLNCYYKLYLDKACLVPEPGTHVDRYTDILQSCYGRPGCMYIGDGARYIHQYLNKNVTSEIICGWNTQKKNFLFVRDFFLVTVTTLLENQKE